MSSLTSGIGGGLFGGQEVRPATRWAPSTRSSCWLPPRPTPAQSGGGGEVAHGCPRFQVWSRDGYVTIYEPGRVGDGLAVMHRGEITKTARECNIEPGRVTVKYGFSGRVLLGQKGKTGRVSLPVNVFVTDAKREKIATDKLKVDVDVAARQPDRLLLDRALGDLRDPRGLAPRRVRGLRRLRPHHSGRRLTPTSRASLAPPAARRVAGLTSGPARVSSRPPIDTCGRDRSVREDGPAPKEQPPRNLSGKRTAGRWHSGKQPAHPGSPKG